MLPVLLYYKLSFIGALICLFGLCSIVLEFGLFSVLLLDNFEQFSSIWVFENGFKWFW